MKPADIEKLIKNVDIDTNAERDRAVLADVLQVLQDSKGKEAAVPQPNIWRIIMKRPVAKLVAAAAVIIIAVLVGINQFGGSIDIARIALADVEKAFLVQPWVHVKYDNGREQWINLRRGKTYFISGKLDSGRIFRYSDRVRNIHQWYASNRLTIRENAYYNGAVVPAWHPRTAWNEIIAPLEKPNIGRYRSVEKHADILDGSEMARFDVYFIDALDQKILVKQLWADPETRMPVRIREKLHSNYRLRVVNGRFVQEAEYITGNFDFPETGPVDIYDLGVPKNVEIVKKAPAQTVEESEPQVSKIIQAGKEASRQFPRQYRMIAWEDKPDGKVTVTYRNNALLQRSNYLNTDDTNYLHMPATTEQVLAWTKTQEPKSVYFSNGDTKKDYNRYTPNLRDHTKQPITKVIRNLGYPYFGDNLKDQLWPYAMWRGLDDFEIISDHPKAPPGCVTLLSGRFHFFVDTEKDYICIKRIRTQNKDDRGRDFWLSDFAQLPTGHWYAKRAHLIAHLNTEREHSNRDEEHWVIDIQLLEEDEFPPDIFNGEKLLEGAKLETY